MPVFLYVMPNSGGDRAGLCDDQQVTRQNNRVSARNDGIQSTLDENDQRVVWKIEITQLFSLPAVAAFHGHFLKGQLLPVLKASCGDDQQISRLKQRIALRDNGLSGPGNHDD